MTNQELARTIREEIENETQQPVIRFTLEKGEPELCGSKIGGTPYLPHETLWPLDEEELPMELLAQIDCAAFQGLPDFPQSGLLQFFISPDETYGADFNNITQPDNFKVLYHETADPSVTAEEVQAKRPVLSADEEEERKNTMPVNTACRICFGAAETQGMTPEDYRFDPLFCLKWNAERSDAPIKSRWDIHCGFYRENAPQHQIGGYPYFTQYDPRSEDSCPDLDVLLFQLDSDYQDKCDLVCWGDCGVANFFISREDLKKRDFSKVGYSWDCG